MKQQLKWLTAASVFAALQSCNLQNSNQTMVAGATDSVEIDRTVLPIKEPARQTYKELDARNAKAPRTMGSKSAKRST
jgi:arylsulfatase